MDFEFDFKKSASNKVKHGIDFLEAQKMWEDGDRVLVPALSSDEPRFVLIAKYKGRLWSAIYTLREEKIRLISVRRSRPEERETYES